jgi:Ca2+-binding RTX toxin-like protein
MTITYITKTELANEDGVKNLDSDVRNALFNTLYTDHTYNPGPDDGTKAWFQDDGKHVRPVTLTTQIVELDKNATVDTTPFLNAIIMDDGGKDGSARELKVIDTSHTGNSVFVAMGNAGDTVRLHDDGNDTVYGGTGNDLISARHNTGNDSLIGGGGNDTIWGGVGQDTLIGGAGSKLHSGSLSGGYNILEGQGGHDTLYGGGGADTLSGSGGHDSLVGGTGSGQLVGGKWVHGQLLQTTGGHDTLVAGTGSGQTLQGGGGHDLITDLNSSSSPHYDTLIGSGGNDIIKGQQGDTLTETGGSNASNGSQFYLYGNNGASSTLQGGAGNDTFNIETKTGDVTINGGGGTDLVNLDQSSSKMSGPVTESGGVYTISFKDGQHIHVSGISEVHFTDGETLTGF